MLIWHLVQPLVTWSVAERERRLFHVCVQVQATLMARHPGYTTPQVHEVPEALVAETQEILGAILSEISRWDTRPAGLTEPRTATGVVESTYPAHHDAGISPRRRG